MTTTIPRLWTTSYIFAFISNMMLFFAYYMLAPLLPLFVMEELSGTETTAGIVMAVFTVMSLISRPISGFLVDRFNRKPLYIIFFILYTIFFGGYALSKTIIVFAFMRILHGVTFGINTVSSATIAIDVMPEERRNEGVGYFGMACSIAMGMGPLVSFLLYEHFSFEHIFLTAFSVSMLGVLATLPIKTTKKAHNIISEKKEPKEKVHIPIINRFLLFNAMPCVGLLLALSYGYGVLSNFIALYCKGSHFACKPGHFFICFAFTIAITRIFATRIIKKGEVLKAAYIGSFFLAISYILFIYCHTALLFYGTAIIGGIGFGYITPAFQAMLVNLASHQQRGAANATFYTFWDMGIGLGMATGGAVIEYLSFDTLLFICSIVIVVGLIHFKFISEKHYRLHKVLD